MNAQFKTKPSVLLLLLLLTPFVLAQQDTPKSDNTPAPGSTPDPSIPEIADDDFDSIRTAVKPCEGESPWREIKWLTNITEARRRAIAEDKPLVIFTAADGSPLGRT